MAVVSVHSHIHTLINIITQKWVYFSVLFKISPENRWKKYKVRLLFDNFFFLNFFTSGRAMSAWDSWRRCPRWIVRSGCWRRSAAATLISCPYLVHFLTFPLQVSRPCLHFHHRYSAKTWPSLLCHFQGTFYPNVSMTLIGNSAITKNTFIIKYL